MEKRISFFGSLPKHFPPPSSNRQVNVYASLKFTLGSISRIPPSATGSPLCVPSPTALPPGSRTAEPPLPGSGGFLHPPELPGPSQVAGRPIGNTSLAGTAYLTPPMAHLVACRRPFRSTRNLLLRERAATRRPPRSRAGTRPAVPPFLRVRSPSKSPPTHGASTAVASGGVLRPPGLQGPIVRSAALFAIIAHAASIWPWRRALSPGSVTRP